MNFFARLVVFSWGSLMSASAQSSPFDPFDGLFDPPPARQPAQQRSPNGPWNNDVLIYRVNAEGKPESIGAFERAGVPTAARMADGRLLAAFQHFPKDDERNFDRVAVSFSSDEGKTWSKAQPIVVEGMEEGLMRPFDPTLVPLPDGRVRVYFTSNRARDFRQSTPEIYSAISSDGVNYTFEPGVRFGIEGRVVIDCAVVLHQGVFHLYSPDNGTAEDFHNSNARHEPPPGGTGYHATSTDGLAFTRVDDVKLDDQDVRWLGSAQSNGQTITFFATGRGIFTSTSRDGTSWQPAARLAVPGADPGAVALKDGGWLVVVTGPPSDQWIRDWVEEIRLFDALW
ncbi:MAG: exo-alpha-sialidase [Verrucomicrobiaceae bacterium]|nr:exo-alpha-sialidase [Verrucomicrobiaceae bacterium]